MSSTSETNRTSKRRGFQPGKPKTGGRKAGVPNKTTAAAKEFAQSLVDNPDYRKALEKRIAAGKIAPAVETMIWHYAYGKPKETVALEGHVGVSVGDINKMGPAELERAAAEHLAYMTDLAEKAAKLARGCEDE